MFETDHGVDYDLLASVAVVVFVTALLSLDLVLKPRRTSIRILLVMPALIVRVSNILYSRGFIPLTDLSLIGPFLAIGLFAV